MASGRLIIAQMEMALMELKSWLTVGAPLYMPRIVMMELMIPSDITYMLLPVLIRRRKKLTTPSKIIYIMKITFII
jgi:hypothetical protein